MKVFQQDPDNLDERLQREAYAIPALVPASPWLPSAGYSAPIVASRIEPSTGDCVIDMSLAKAARNAPWLWTIQTRTESGWKTEIVPGSHRVFALGAPGGTPHHSTCA